MNDNYTSYNENAVQISIPNLMLYILRHWRSLIAAIVIGLLLGGALSAWKLPNVASQDEVEDVGERPLASLPGRAGGHGVISA